MDGSEFANFIFNFFSGPRLQALRVFLIVGGLLAGSIIWLLTFPNPLWSVGGGCFYLGAKLFASKKRTRYEVVATAIQGIGLFVGCFVLAGRLFMWWPVPTSDTQSTIIIVIIITLDTVLGIMTLRRADKNGFEFELGKPSRSLSYNQSQEMEVFSGANKVLSRANNFTFILLEAATFVASFFWISNIINGSSTGRLFTIGPAFFSVVSSAIAFVELELNKN